MGINELYQFIVDDAQYAIIGIASLAIIIRFWRVSQKASVGGMVKAVAAPGLMYAAAIAVTAAAISYGKPVLENAINSAEVKAIFDIGNTATVAIDGWIESAGQSRSSAAGGLDKLNFDTPPSIGGTQRVDFSSKPMTASVDASAKESASTAPQAAPGQMYTVRFGDTLSDIASAAYGSGNLWTKICAANASLRGNCGNIRVGQRLRIPGTNESVPATLDNGYTLANNLLNPQRYGGTEGVDAKDASIDAPTMKNGYTSANMVLNPQRYGD